MTMEDICSLLSDENHVNIIVFDNREDLIYAVDYISSFTEYEPCCPDVDIYHNSIYRSVYHSRRNLKRFHTTVTFEPVKEIPPSSIYVYHRISHLDLPSININELINTIFE